MVLAEVSPGASFTIIAIPDPQVRLQVLRLGFGEGAVATLQTRVPGGPVILRRHGQEFALGHHLARTIQVQPGAAGGKVFVRHHLP